MSPRKRVAATDSGASVPESVARLWPETAGDPWITLEEVLMLDDAAKGKLDDPAHKLGLGGI